MHCQVHGAGPTEDHCPGSCDKDIGGTKHYFENDECLFCGLKQKIALDKEFEEAIKRTSCLIRGAEWTKVITDAATFAYEIHANQKYGNGSFTKHLIGVGQEAKKFNLPRIVQAAAWLHDAIEDTETTYHDINMKFGKEIAELVYAVTDELGRNRRERKAKTLPKTRIAGKNAVSLKLADRIANIRFSIKTNDNGKVKMYRKEHRMFRDHLYKAGELEEMWTELEILTWEESQS